MKQPIAKRFRGFLPVVIDLETGGFNAQEHALLELAAVILTIDGNGKLAREHTIHSHIEPHAGLKLDPEALKVNGIQPDHPLRIAKSEEKALTEFFTAIKKKLSDTGCSRAIMVAHNAAFDHGFLFAAAARHGDKLPSNPFHSFSTFDTVTLGGVQVGQTVLSRISESLGMIYDSKQAHGAKYDAELTADIFCQLVNQTTFLGDTD